MQNVKKINKTREYSYFSSSNWHKWIHTIQIWTAKKSHEQCENALMSKYQLVERK